MSNIAFKDRNLIAKDPDVAAVGDSPINRGAKGEGLEPTSPLLTVQQPLKALRLGTVFFPRPTEFAEKIGGFFVGNSVPIIGDNDPSNAAETIRLKVYVDLSRVSVETIPDKLRDGGDRGCLQGCLVLNRGAAVGG
jgi:hypothetical protein